MKTTPLLALAFLAGPLAPWASPEVAEAQPPATEIVLENASIRVMLAIFVPGGATGWHQGIEGEIGIIAEGELTVESPTGRQSLKPGGRLLDAGLDSPRRAEREPAPRQDVGHPPQALRLRAARRRRRRGGRR